MALYSDPPPPRPFSEDKPTLLVCWWITIFCAVIIALRVVGRFIRTEKLFREDKTAALALVPLFLRMGCVHVILIYGTNNAILEGAGFSDEELHQRSIASGLVLLSRVLYAATLWILKYAILEFFKRLKVTWRRTYDWALMFIRGFLVTTFIAVVISDLAECQPFSNYWQVLPDPGGQCRQGYAQLLTMAVCNVITDLLLVMVPIPVILSSSMSAARKFQLVLLFCLSLAPVAVTIYRVPHIIDQHGSQRTRSLYASVELLFATAAANALVLGSFVRDRGVKKKRFKYDSIAAGSIDRSSASDSRRPTALRHWGSDEDLVRDLGLGVTPELRDTRPSSNDHLHPQYTPAPPAHAHTHAMESWNFPSYAQRPSTSPLSEETEEEEDHGDDKPTPSSEVSASRGVSFFDYGGLLNDQNPTTTLNTARGNLSSPSSSSSTTPSPSTTKPPDPAVTASGSGFRRGSSALLQDLGGFLAPPGSRTTRQKSRPKSASRPLSPIRQGETRGDKTAGPSPTPAPPEPSSARAGRASGSGGQGPELMDVGGLLGASGR
ncbi:hypothetical protein B0J18DRAFT_50498 [Chaetomium sp. MPI-SDFR-AT-0129]|nr:hypothetical protein B0J18DRAFT_50498 [Chaetomium sp. MPI-SDFR-AT-0129]